MVRLSDFFRGVCVTRSHQKQNVVSGNGGSLYMLSLVANMRATDHLNLFH